MTTKYYINEDGSYLGAWDGSLPPEGAIEVPFPPLDARQMWDFVNEVWLPLPPQPYVLPVAVFWMNMTDEEAEDFDAAMATATPLRLRRAFNTANNLASDGELFTFVHGVLVGVVGATRADEIMAEPVDTSTSRPPEEAE